MIDGILYIVGIDWSLALLLLAALAFAFGVVVAFVAPIWGGWAASSDEIPSMGILVGSRLALVPMGLFGLVWIVRALIWVVRWLVCPTC